MKLKWKGIWDTAETFEKTAVWYREYYENKKIISEEHLNKYIHDAKNHKVLWAD